MLQLFEVEVFLEWHMCTYFDVGDEILLENSMQRGMFTS